MYNYTPLTNLATSMPAIVARSVITSRKSDPPPVKIWQIQPCMLVGHSVITRDVHVSYLRTTCSEACRARPRPDYCDAKARTRRSLSKPSPVQILIEKWKRRVNISSNKLFVFNEFSMSISFRHLWSSHCRNIPVYMKPQRSRPRAERSRGQGQQIFPRWREQPWHIEDSMPSNNYVSLCMCY